MVQILPKKTGTVPFHSLVNVKHVSEHTRECILMGMACIVFVTLPNSLLVQNKCKKRLFCLKEGNCCVYVCVLALMCVLFKTL